TTMSTKSQSIGETIGYWLTKSSDPDTAREQEAAHNQALANIQSQGQAKIDAIKTEEAAALAANEAERQTAMGIVDAERDKQIAAHAQDVKDAQSKLDAYRETAAKERK